MKVLYGGFTLHYPRSSINEFFNEIKYVTVGDK